MKKESSVLRLTLAGAVTAPGIRARSSLESQVTEACRVVETLALNKPVSIMGAGMKNNVSGN